MRTPLLLATLALTGCASLPSGLTLADADGTLAFEKDGFRVSGGDAFRFAFDPTPETMEQHGAKPGRWLAANVTVENAGTRPRHLAGPEGDPYAVVLPTDVRIVDENGAWAKVFTGRRWQDGDLVNGDVFAPGERGDFTIMFFDSERLADGPVALFIEDEGVRIGSVRETNWTFRP